jgi:flavin-binding protein dodecin
MSVAKVIEISSTSQQSFEDAINKGIQRATSSLRNVTGAWIKEQQVGIENNRITSYRVNLMVTFILNDSDDMNTAGGGA